MPRKIKKAKVAKLLQNARKAGESAETANRTPKKDKSDLRPGWYPEASAPVVVKGKKTRGKKGRKKLPIITPMSST
jgi:hypothetical protein